MFHFYRKLQTHIKRQKKPEWQYLRQKKILKNNDNMQNIKTKHCDFVKTAFALDHLEPL